MLRSFGVIALTLSATCAYAGSCEDMLFGENPEDALPEKLAPAAVDLGATESFISYLELLIEEKVLSFAELKVFGDHLVEGQMVNPVSLTAKLSSSRQIHAQALESFLPRENIDASKLREWVQLRLSASVNEQFARPETREETTAAFTQLTLYPIRGGRLKNLPPSTQRPVIVADFELMTTDVTQRMWVERMGENASKFNHGPNSATLVYEGREYRAQPDNPVESLTWWSAMEYANRESEARGLKPAYDLSGIRMQEDTRAENGTLAPISKGEGHENVRYTSASGKPEDTEGFRLPQEKEWQYLVENYLDPLARGVNRYDGLAAYGIFKETGFVQVRPADPVPEPTEQAPWQLSKS